jgi:hypothetical protein
MIERYARAVQAVLQGSALPYGYTITVWSTGAVVMGRHGSPGVGFVFLFAAGAIAGFAAMVVIGRAARSDALEPASGDLLAAGVAHVAAVGAAIGAAALIARIGGGVAWPLASFAATAVYLALASLELLLARRAA